ncbi:enoyl-CoA hydratase/isomerase family protein [Sciscionella marina]|uniref:enoyl-CoA hydratase/isomerase family protein n=1 Tax=Sciscionella marina TaxID=508770 RepID=UPI000381D8F1|nr:enoyl-CoA hydratase-related protein [Sciscionella marina]
MGEREPGGDDVLALDEPDPGVVRLTLNRPHRSNALTAELMSGLGGALDRISADPDVRVVVLAGAGTAFCSGFDLEEIEGTWALPLPELLSAQQNWALTTARLAELAVPVIAAVDGPAVGAGMSLALAADLRVATQRSRFAAAFVRIGLSGADMGLSWTLPRVVGSGVAAELMLTGRELGGEQAARLGLVNSICEPELLHTAALELAGEIGANSPFGVRLTKQALRTGQDASSLRAAIDNENRNQLLASRSEDMAESMAARTQRRTPDYRNR